jgi:isochorismate hydrolase
MSRKALVVIDIQNDITKHYREIIDRINDAIDWAVENGLEVVYIKHNNLSAGTRTFKPDTKGAELVPELKIASDNIFVKTKANALTSAAFSEYIQGKDIDEFYITGADATDIASPFYSGNAFDQVDKVLFHNPCYNRVSVLRHEDQMILQDVAAVPVFMRFFLRPARHGCPLLD